MSYLERVTECETCGEDGCRWGERRQRITVDYEAAAKEYLFSTGHYENPDEVWDELVPISVRVAAREYSKRIVDAALGVDTE